MSDELSEEHKLEIERAIWVLEFQMLDVEHVQTFWRLFGTGMMPREPSKDVL